MKTHSQDFKDNICLLGKQQEVKITYTENDEEKVLTGEDINNATPHYKADLLKSVMKELDLDSNVDIPVNTEINFQYGLLVDNEYEYLDYGNYIVFSSEKQEDTLSYKIKCYDKLIYSMKPYENMNIVYPTTIRSYINSLCNYLGITFASAGIEFTNYNKTIPTELYLDSQGNDLGYTFRDVLDELAQVTGSVVCVNNNDELEIRYINNTNDTIDEEYLKDINVNFGEKYGPINTVILSRSADADKISLSNPSNLPDDEKIAIEIKDNQIMNFNNRDEFLPALLNRLYGTEYYLNDFTSTGIVYYDLMDKYNVQIGENTYNCLMLNNEVNIDQGLEEQIHTNIPETSDTDYSKTDKTDRRINQTYLIVDKQNQRIDSVVTNVTEQNDKISQITQTVDELNSKIQDIADITIAGESIQGVVQLDNINQSEPIELKVHPITENISYLYPRDDLFPSDSLFMTDRKVRFLRTYEEDGETKTENIDYELPEDLLYYNSEIYDEFYLNYDSETCQVIKKCERTLGNNIYNPYKSGLITNAFKSTNQNGYITLTPIFDGSVSFDASQFFQFVSDNYTLSFSDLENITSTDISTTISYYDSEKTLIGSRTVTGTSLIINKADIDNTSYYFSLSFSFANRRERVSFKFYIMLNEGTTALPYEKYAFYVKPLAQTIINDYEYPQILLNDGDYEISLLGYNIGYISVRLMTQNIYTTQFATKAELSSSITQTANEINLRVDEKLDEEDFTSANIMLKINNDVSQATINADKINLNGAVTANNNFKILTDGSMEAVNAKFTGGKVQILGGTVDNPNFSISGINTNEFVSLAPDGFTINSSDGSSYLRYSNRGSTEGEFDVGGERASLQVLPQNRKINLYARDVYVVEGKMHAEAYYYDSKESIKKNIKLYDQKALEVVKNGEIYKYNFKTDEDGERKYFGFVIPDEGGKYKTPIEVMSNDNQGINVYNMCSILWKAVQEQQETIENLQNQINELKGDKINE